MFDLSGMHSAVLPTRVRVALLVGLDRAQDSSCLQTLTALPFRNPSGFFTNAKGVASRVGGAQLSRGHDLERHVLPCGLEC